MNSQKRFASICKKINIDPNSPARALIEQIKSLMETINQQRGELINKFHEKNAIYMISKMV